ncbi:GAT-like domain-containing protein [Aspergillus bertholletiae]|uniref:GAT-like domain-containing protein n=1 Tax=Aspergillus bertholletiae TaxID=1226010 RepID=A0A5N7B0I2_9EURO|nr:GAT-like domain-containing protein [Aspergillus bertholletiae]
MKRILTSFSKRSGSTPEGPSSYAEDSPEGIILREVNAFCEAPPSNAQGTEFVHLPAIVESAESSPNAAKEAANRIRKLLSDPASTPGNVQYNAIMLIRILVDNPGHTFTRNIDAKFVATVKDLLRLTKDSNVQGFLKQTLDALEMQRGWDEDLAPLLQMWIKEKTKIRRTNSGSTWRSPQTSPQPQQPRPDYFGPRQTGTLPPPDELAARITEARTSAKLLVQFVQSTPSTEMEGNELIKEFSDRCRSASHTIQHYIHSTNPPPDEDTLLTLIEANDEISVSLSRHQRALLDARRALGQSGSQSPSSSEITPSGAFNAIPPPVPPRDTQNPSIPPALPPTTSASGIPTQSNNGMGRSEYRSEDFQVQNPFADNFSSTAAGPSGGRMEGTVNDSWYDPYQQPIQRA